MESREGILAERRLKRVEQLEAENTALRQKLKALVESNDRMKKALRTIRDDKSFGPNAEKLLRSVARLSLLEEAKHCNQAAIEAAKEG